MAYGDLREYTDSEWERHQLTGFVVKIDQDHKTIQISHDCPKDPNDDDVVLSTLNAFAPDLAMLQSKDLIRFRVHIVEYVRYIHSVEILMRDGEFWKMVRGQKK